MASITRVACIAFALLPCSACVTPGGDLIGEGTTTTGATTSTGSGSNAAESSSESTTVGSDAVECIPPDGPELVVFMEASAPASESEPIHHLDTVCLVTEVSAGDPVSIQLHCPDEAPPVDWELQLSGLLEPVPTLVAGDEVELYYSSSLPAMNIASAALRKVGDEMPLVIAHAGGGLAASELLYPLVVTYITGTNCEVFLGDCGLSMRRVAIEVSIEGVGSSVVFDHHDAALGPYRIQVGEATREEAPCNDGFGEAGGYRYVIVRTD